MPKRLYQIKDFSGGLNNLKDPADIADNEVSTSKGFMYNLQGIIQPAYSMALAANQLTSSTYSNNVELDTFQEVLEYLKENEDCILNTKFISHNMSIVRVI